MLDKKKTVNKILSVECKETGVRKCVLEEETLHEVVTIECKET